jgi:hypothetical protein
MRGKKLFKTTFKEKAQEQGSRGRNVNLIARRNYCLLDRYFYYGHYTDKRFDAIIENLCTEFFLSKRTLQDIIDANETYLLELKKKKPRLSLLEMRWPHMKW